MHFQLAHRYNTVIRVIDCLDFWGLSYNLESYSSTPIFYSNDNNICEKMNKLYHKNREKEFVKIA